MWRDRHIHSVKTKSQAGSIWVYLMTKQKGQSHKTLSLRSQKFIHFAWKFSKGPWVQEWAHLPPKSCWNFTKWFKEGHSWSIVIRVKVGIKATCQHFKSWRILEEMTELLGPFATTLQELWYPGKGTKLDCIIQLWGTAHPCKF